MVDFKVGDTVVYPSHGIGKITSEEVQIIGEHQISVFVVMLNRDKLTLRVPKKRAESVGLRPVCSREHIEEMFRILALKPKQTKGMWSKRAQEYESKISSGNILQIAEVVRDLYKNVEDPDRSYSERVIYESAFNRVISEYAAVEGIEETDASIDLIKILKDASVTA
jgi:CarD family transcriptional regulator